jgi:hypothetical protein
MELREWSVTKDSDEAARLKGKRKGVCVGGSDRDGGER